MKWKHPFDQPRNPNLINLMNEPNDAAAPLMDFDKASIEKQKSLAAKTAMLARVENDFTYHAPKGDQAERYALIRDSAKKLARVLVENCPQSAELSVAVRHLDTVVFNANAAIARNE